MHDQDLSGLHLELIRSMKTNIHLQLKNEIKVFD